MYILQLYKLSGEHRAYSDNVPDYPKGCPKSAIFDCLKGNLLQEDIKILEHEVFKGDGRKHSVNFNIPECSCTD